jgi:hypothetical protein
MSYYTCCTCHECSSRSSGHDLSKVQSGTCSSVVVMASNATYSDTATSQGLARLSHGANVFAAGFICTTQLAHIRKLRSLALI